MSGRGGAGNILNVQQEKKRVIEDVEAGKPILDRGSDSGSVQPSQQQYAHSGRGGAGNYFSPQELEKTGKFDVPSSVTSKTNSAAEPVRRYGRGGAGNMSFGVTEDEERAAVKKLEEEAVKREKLKADVEASVDAALAEPPKARLPHSNAYSA